MERVSALYAQSSYKGRLKVEAAKKPVLALRLAAKGRVLDEAAAFIADWLATGKAPGAEAGKGEKQ